MAELAARAGEVHRAGAHQTLTALRPPPGELRTLAQRQAMLLLDTLLAQKQAGIAARRSHFAPLASAERRASLTADGASWPVARRQRRLGR